MIADNVRSDRDANPVNAGGSEPDDNSVNAGGSEPDDNSVNAEPEPHGSPVRKKKKGKGETKRMKNQHLREKGKVYIGNRGENKQARSIKPRCKCARKDHRHCADFSEQDRVGIFTSIWETLTWDQKKVMVMGLVDVGQVKQRTTGPVDSRRKVTLSYYLRKDGERKPVCKKMFLSTTGLGEWSVRAWATSVEPHQIETKIGKARRQSSYYSRCDDDRKFLRNEFLEKLPKLPSHYCRSSTTKMYLEPIIESKAKLYKLYCDKCRANGKTPLCQTILDEEFDNMNLSLFRPKKDQCDTCVSHEAGNITDEEWNRHREKVNAARKEKDVDKNQALEEEEKKTLVLTMDLQAVLLAPRLQASALYYKTKLCVHNFTIFDLVSRNVVCYVWHEGEGALTASEFASCVIDYLTNHLQYDTYILYSDGCTYQNRNVILANALSRFSKEHNKTVMQKILERGHTQMEVDSAHAAIERKLKNKNIYCPADYVQVMREARSKPSSYTVKYLTYDFFKDFTDTGSLTSIRPGSRVGDPTVTDLRCLKYGATGDIQYKIRYSDEWEDLPRPRRSRQDRSAQGDHPLQPLYHTRRKIPESKYQHLQQLKFVMPADYHAFYDQLSH